ncbi:MAG: tetratricopeptide repeat protein [Acidobacteriota bacterium]
MSDSISPVDPSLRRWELVGLLALGTVVLAVPLSRLRPPNGPRDAGPEAVRPSFVGTAACKECHAVAYEKWRSSDHAWAMARATPETVLGDFDDAVFTHRGVTSRFYRGGGRYYVFTEGPGGKMGEFEITYTFGVRPLQQYLVHFPGGRLQALSIAWDSVQRRWFHLQEEQDVPASDWLHWTRNGQNWNGMCAECHSTNLRKNYDPKTDTYATTWTDINVGCEACHGPGSQHVAWAKMQPMARPELADGGLLIRTRDITSERLVELCAPCHSRHAELGDYDHTGRQLMDQMLPTLLVEGLYFPDGQQLDEVYTYASFLQSKMYARGVRCSNCHDSHSAKLLPFPGNELCLQCHQREIFDTPGHHFHKQVVDGRASPGASCVKCHMPERPYMVIDWRADHSFRVPRPDLTAEISVPNACGQTGCHADKPVAWAVDAFRKWYGIARKPHFANTFAAARGGEPRAEADLRRLADNPLQPGVVRATALDLLSRYPGQSTTDSLRNALAADDPLLRDLAVSRLVLPDARERAATLAPLLCDPVRAVRIHAASALAGTPRELLKPYQREAFDRALGEYREAMSYSLDFASSGYNLGNLEASLGHAAEAERYFRLALSVDELFFPAKVNLSVLLAEQGRAAEAERLLRDVVAAYPGNAEAAYSLGLLLGEAGRNNEAAEWLARAAAGWPRHARVRYNLGLVLARLGRIEEARTTLREALPLAPADYDALFALADLELRDGRPREALVLAERMIAERPNDPAGLQLRAAAARLLGAGQ